MNKIYWDKDKITILTDQIEAVEHKHYAMQLFLGLEKDLNFDTPSHFAAVTKRMMGIPASLSLKNSVFLKVFHA